jgi:hypothetical protein
MHQIAGVEVGQITSAPPAIGVPKGVAVFVSRISFIHGRIYRRVEEEVSGDRGLSSPLAGWVEVLIAGGAEAPRSMGSSDRTADFLVRLLFESWC